MRTSATPTPSAHVVLGASGGIGRELGRRLVARGDRVLAVGRNDASVAALAAGLDTPASTDTSGNRHAC